MDNFKKQSVPFTGVAAVPGRGGMMSTTCLLAWLVCAASFTTVVGEWSHYCGTERSERYIAQGRCGSQLAETLSVVCRMFGGYNSRSFGKRAASPAMSTPASLWSSPALSASSSYSSPVTSLAAAAATARAVRSAIKPSKRHGELDDEKSPFWSRSKALSYLQIQKRVIVTRNGQAYRQGIVCECCMHRCNLGELYEYCADPSYSVTKRGGGGPQGASSPSSSSSHSSSSNLPVDAGNANSLLLPPPGSSESFKVNQTGLGLPTLEEGTREDGFGGERYPNTVIDDQQGFGLMPAILDTSDDDEDNDDRGYEEQLKREGAVAEQLSEVGQTDSLLQQILRLSLQHRLGEDGQDQRDRK